MNSRGERVEHVERRMRNPAIELYRVVLMFLIVLHHAAYHGHWNHAQGLDAAWPSIYWLFTALTIWHVDGFISITGWFGIKFSLSRFAKLWGVITFYSILSIAYGWWSNGRLSATYLAGGWFGQTYLCFLFMTPILNAAIEKLSGGGGKYMYLSWIIFDMAIILNWTPYHLLTGVAGSGMESVSIMTFVAVYVNARLLKMSGLAKYFSKKVFLICYVLFLANVGLKVVTPIGLGYNSPLVMLMAISSLLLFAEHIKLPAFIAKMVLWLSPLMFGVYIMHETTTFGRLIYRIPQQWAATQLHWHPLLIIFITAVICFIVCAFVDLLRRTFVVPLLRPVNNLIAMLDARFGLPQHTSCLSLQKGGAHD